MTHIMNNLYIQLMSISLFVLYSICSVSVVHSTKQLTRRRRVDVLLIKMENTIKSYYSTKIVELLQE